jgi:hypothetical protein
MKKLTVVCAALLLVTACGGTEDRSLSAACAPAVSVVVPSVGNAHGRSEGVAQRREVVQVYWDVSRSMRDFAVTHRARGGTAGEADDLTPVVATLDSSVLLRAHAETVEQFGVGESIAQLPSARAALHPNANRTALHLAAEQIGSALATGSAQAALVVSDMELDTPPRTAASHATVCGDVPLPSTPLAGSLFGRCLEHAVLAAGGPAKVRTHFLAHVFRKSSHGRELFILLLATDRAFGRRISDEIVSRLDFSRQVIFDSGAVAAANVRGCTLTATPGVLPRGAGCGVKCFDADATIQGQCDLRRTANDAWVYPAGRGLDGVTYESLKKAGDRDERAMVRFAIPCTTPPGRFNASVSFTWRERTPRSRDGKGEFARNASARDLFDSLSDAIVRIVAPRELRIGIDLAR